MELFCLESHDDTEGVACGTRVSGVVHTVEDFRVDTFVTGNDEGVLDGTVEADAQRVVEEVVPGVTQGDVVAAYETGVLQIVVGEVLLVFEVYAVVFNEVAERGVAVGVAQECAFRAYIIIYVYINILYFFSLLHRTRNL